jgi:hypothetical protein
MRSIHQIRAARTFSLNAKVWPQPLLESIERRDLPGDTLLQWVLPVLPDLVPNAKPAATAFVSDLPESPAEARRSSPAGEEADPRIGALRRMTTADGWRPSTVTAFLGTMTVSPADAKTARQTVESMVTAAGAFIRGEQATGPPSFVWQNPWGVRLEYDFSGGRGRAAFGISATGAGQITDRGEAGDRPPQRRAPIRVRVARATTSSVALTNPWARRSIFGGHLS